MNTNRTIAFAMPVEPSRGRLLRGAAVIAKRLGVSVSTVRRLASTKGLPVFQLGEQTSPVCAYSREIDDWMARQREAV